MSKKAELQIEALSWADLEKAAVNSKATYVRYVIVEKSGSPFPIGELYLTVGEAINGLHYVDEGTQKYYGVFKCFVTPVEEIDV